MLGFVLGTRPEIVKLAPVMRALPPETWLEVWTGQHWDPRLVEAIRQPFGVKGRRIELQYRDASVWKVGWLMADLEAVIRHERLTAVVVEGDTDSALAGALGGAGAGVPVVHVEAGMRSWESDLPEERNRRLIGQLATLHCCPTAVQRANLLAEGIPASRLFVTGNPVVDALAILKASTVVARAEPPYVVATLHRAEVFPILEHCLALLEALPMPVRLYAHPRTLQAAAGVTGLRTVELRPAAPYATFLEELTGAWAVVTDSGGIQEEALTLGVPCITLRKGTERPETAWWSGNVVVDPRRLTPRLLRRLVMTRVEARPHGILGDGRSGERIATLLETRFLV